MRTTIDSAGRLVIPKDLRERAGLQAGPVEVSERDGRVVIEPAPVEMSVVTRDGIEVAVPKSRLPALTDEVVRETLEKVRR